MSHIRVRELEIRAVSAMPAPDDLAIIASAQFAGRQVTDGEVAVRKMRLAHNQYDRTAERFPKAYLDRFAETAPGKSVLAGHDHGGLPLGMMFRASVRQRQEAGFPMLQTAGGPTGDGIRPGSLRFAAADQRVTWLETDWYHPADTAAGQELQRNVDLGIYKWVSIGFAYDDLLCDICKASYWGKCPHIAGWWAEDGTLATITYGGDPNVAETLEGSIVYLGAQQQARLVKQIRDGSIDVEAISLTPYGEDLVQRKEAEALARKFGCAQKVWAFPQLAVKAAIAAPEVPSIGGAPDPAVAGSSQSASVGATTTESEVSMTDEEKRALADAQKRATDAEAAVATEKTAREKAETELATLKAREPLAAVGEKALEQAFTDLCEHYVRLERGPEFTELAKSLRARGDFAKLTELAKSAFGEVCKRFPAAPSGDPTAGREEEAPKPAGPAYRPEYARLS